MTSQGMNQSRVEIYCPTEAELQTEPQVNVQCTVDGCDKTFNTSAARNIHVIQTHKIYKNDEERKRFSRGHQKDLSKVIKHFYCPVSRCNRSLEWQNPFTRLSLLKQHYYILHAEKKYQCEKCDKRFSTQGLCTTHQRTCGKDFFCSCGEKHNSVRALYMHAKRKDHALPPEFAHKRKKREEVKERYVLVVPVPFGGNPGDVQKVMRNPFPILPNPASCIPMATTPYLIGHIPPGIRNAPSTATTPDQNGNTSVMGNNNSVKTCQFSSTTSTQTDEPEVTSTEPKLDTNCAYAQTAHSCFPSFIPMMSGPRTFKRHKKTLAIQTHASWPQTKTVHPGQTSTSQTQTLDGREGNSQTLSVPDCLPPLPNQAPPLENPLPSSLFSKLSESIPLVHNFPDPLPFHSPQPSSASKSTSYSYSNTSPLLNVSSSSQPPSSHMDTNSTQTMWSLIKAGASDSPTLQTPADIPSSSLLQPNEALTQTDVTFQNFMEYNTSETQTFSSVTDAMTDTSETPILPSAVDAVSKPTPPPTSLAAPGGPDMAAPPSLPCGEMGMTGLDLLFLASTEHRASSSLEALRRLDDSSCCQQTQTAFGDADTGHQETQTAWDWSLDEFSFLDQYTQTALSTNTSVNASASTTIPESDQLCQTDMELYSQFAFSNTETQTVFDLGLFGNSISVQTEPGSSASSSTGLLGDLTDVNKQVQVPTALAAQMVSADVQTEALDFDLLRTRQMGSGQLASSQTQTALWEDIESLMRSDNFTQTQFP